MGRISLCILLFHVGAVISGQGLTDSILQIIETVPNNEKPHLYNELSAHNVKDYPLKAIEYAAKALEFSKLYYNTKDRALAFFHTGLAYQYTQEYDVSQENLLLALSLFEELKDTTKICETLNNLGYNYFKLKNPDEALKLYFNALEIAKTKEEPILQANIYNTIALAYGEKGLYDDALDFHYRALTIYKRANSEAHLSVSYNNIGIILTEQNKFNEAKQYYLMALEINSKFNRLWSMAEALNNLGELYMKIGDYETSGETLKKANKIITDIGAKDLKVDNLRYTFQLHQKTGRYKQAFDALHEFHYLDDTVNSLNRLNRMNTLQNAYKLKIKEQEIELKNRTLEILERSKRITLLKRSIVLGSLVFIMIIALIYYKKQKDKVQKNWQLLKTKQELIQTELTYKNNELMNLALQLVQKNDFLEEIKNHLKKLEKKGNVPVNELHGLVVELNKNLRSSKELKNFYKKIKSVNYQFINKLKELYPSLTEGEIRLSTLLRLNLTSKEIAFMKNTSPKSVDMSRYRLRKKMNLSSSENLVEFLKQITV